MLPLDDDFFTLLLRVYRAKLNVYERLFSSYFKGLKYGGVYSRPERDEPDISFGLNLSTNGSMAGDYCLAFCQTRILYDPT